MQSKSPLRIVVGSPNDVTAEKEMLREIVEKINRGIAAEKAHDLKLYTWETEIYPRFHVDGFPGAIDEALDIDNCDVLICIFWKRFGTPVKDAKGGTEHEFNRARRAWTERNKPEIMVYFSQNPYTLKTVEEARQLENVLQFKANLPPECLPWDYRDPNHFKELVSEHLTRFVVGSSFFKVHDFTVEIKVDPLKNISHEVRYGGIFKPPRPPFIVTTDNKAHVQRKVTFGKNNECNDFFDLSYRTQNEGIITIANENINEIRRLHEVTSLTRRLKDAYDDHGRELLYHFRPKRGSTYTLDIDVYKGFDEGHRCLRVICSRPTYCERFRFEVDLTAFVLHHYKVTEEPKLFFYSDAQHQPEDGEVIPHTSHSPGGIWNWDIKDKTVDSIYVKWNVAKMTD